MKTILVIDDHSPEARHAAAFALMIAQTDGADLLIADTVKNRQVSNGVPVVAGRATLNSEDSNYSTEKQLSDQIDPKGGYIPVIRELDISAYAVTELIAFINREEIWLMVEGLSNGQPATEVNLKTNIQSVLNRVRCPLLLVPSCWDLKKPERIVYLADLRYCRQLVLKYLGLLAAPFAASISVAHLSAKGLVDIVETYATEIFEKQVRLHVPDAHITLHNIRERDLHQVVDVLINGMHHDLMVLVNHRSHFEELIGRQIGGSMPADLTIPVLIFPL